MVVSIHHLHGRSPAAEGLADDAAGLPGVLDGGPELSMEGDEVGPIVDLFAVERRLLAVGRGVLAVLGGVAAVVGRGGPVSRGVSSIARGRGAPGLVGLEQRDRVLQKSRGRVGLVREEEYCPAGELLGRNGVVAGRRVRTVFADGRLPEALGQCAKAIEQRSRCRRVPVSRV